eukprot:jgi/Psemu1/288854/fgenesh1_pg.294_\
MPLEQKRNHPSPSSGYAPSARGDPGMHYDDADADVDVNGTTRTRTRTSISVPFVDHWDGRRFWSDRFYLNDNDGTASTTPPPPTPSPTPSPASPNHHAAHANKFRRCHCDCGSRGPPPTFPLIDFVNRSLDVEAAILGTFHLHPEWFLEHFPRFGGGSGSGSGSVNGGANTDTDANANADNPGTVPAPVPVPIPTLILHAFVQNHFGLESLSDFASAFHFETARTYLVPVVPGDHTYDPLNDDDVQHKHKHKHKYHNNNNCFYYGRQRVRYVLEHLATTAPRISKRTRDAGKSDRLLVQPTSLGGDWSRSEWAAMAAAAELPPLTRRVPHFKSLARLFPNHSAMRKRGVGAADAYLSWFLMTSACLSQGAQGKTVEADADAIHTGTHTGTGTADKKPSSSTSSSSSSSGRVSVVGYRNFELGVLFVSHLPKPAKQKKRSPRSSGAPQPARQQKQPKQQQRGLVYCFRRHSCSCGGDSDLDHPRNDPDSASPSRPRSTSPPPRLVHLPIPYDLRPESYFPTVATATATAKGKPTSGSSGDGNRIYCEDEDEEHDTNWWRMKENPFFHEILDSSRCVGNMLLTPFGREERRKLITE